MRIRFLFLVLSTCSGPTLRATTYSCFSTEESTNQPCERHRPPLDACMKAESLIFSRAAARILHSLRFLHAKKSSDEQNKAQGSKSLR
ncbi:hypothetical protein LY78DRAFT_424671 [Colletotrichum sublineola]|nr:hypothetical protein LY78DRAFT_424671 [Colletotrichum sublineola]